MEGVIWHPFMERQILTSTVLFTGMGINSRSRRAILVEENSGKKIENKE